MQAGTCGGVVGLTLGVHFGGPGQHRDVGAFNAEILKIFSVCRDPDAGEIWMAAARARRWCREVHLPILEARRVSPTFALHGHFQPSRRKIPFAFNTGAAKTGENGPGEDLASFLSF
jgi:hypothetical protein